MFISKKGLHIVKKTGLHNMPLGNESKVEVIEKSVVKATVVKKATAKKNNDATETVE